MFAKLTEHLRRASVADVPAISALVREAYEKYVRRIDREPRPMQADYGQAIRDHQCWVVVEDGGGIRAILELAPAADHMLIVNVAVHPRQQNRGYGRALLAFAEDEACRQGLAEIRLYTNVMMVENITLYERLGYVETERRHVDGLHVVFMSKPLV